MNTPVKFEIAKLLWEKEMKKDCDAIYVVSKTNDGSETLLSFKGNYTINHLETCNNTTKNWQWNYPIYSIVDVVMWLYEKHGVWIMVKHLSNTNWMYDIQEGIFSTHAEDKFNSPTKAYEAAIEYCLTKLI